MNKKLYIIMLYIFMSAQLFSMEHRVYFQGGNTDSAIAFYNGLLQSFDYWDTFLQRMTEDGSAYVIVAPDVLQYSPEYHTIFAYKERILKIACKAKKALCHSSIVRFLPDGSADLIRKPNAKMK